MDPEITQRFLDYLDSEEGTRSLKEFGDKIIEEKRVAENRFKRIDEYLKTHSVKDVLDRFISRYTSEYRNKMYDRGIEPHPTGLFALFISYAQDRGIETDSDEVDPNVMFSNTVYKLGDFYFQTICGQGCFERIYDSNKEIIFTS